MANKFRFRHGQMDLRKIAVESATVIEIGDLVYLDADTDSAYAKPASSFPWNSNLATTQADFAEVFLGVAQESSASGQTDDINVDVSPHSVYEFACPSGIYTPDDTLGPDESSNALMDQQLEKATEANSIARVHTAAPSGSTSVLVTVASAYVTGSGNVNANLG